MKELVNVDLDILEEREVCIFVVVNADVGGFVDDLNVDALYLKVSSIYFYNS